MIRRHNSATTRSYGSEDSTAAAPSPTRDAAPIEGQLKEIRALTAGERTELLGKLDVDDVAESHDIPDLVVFLLGTGCRIGEAIATRADAINWADGTITIDANLVRVRGVGLVRHAGKTFAARRVLPYRSSSWICSTLVGYEASNQRV